MDLNPIQGGVAILSVALCYRNQDELRPCGPPWLVCDFTFTYPWCKGGDMDIFWNRIMAVIVSRCCTFLPDTTIGEQNKSWRNIDLCHAAAMLSPRRIKSFVFARLKLFSSFSLQG